MLWSLFFIHFLLYWMSVLAFTGLDWFCKSNAGQDTQCSNCFRKYPWHFQPIKWQELHKDLLSVAVNQLLVTLPLSLGMSYWISFSLEPTPWEWCVFYVGCFLAVEEVLFYYSHRLLHHPLLYRWVHWWHHRWTEPIALITISAHPVEHILSNLLPLIAGPLLLRAPLDITQFWVGIATLNAVISHSGYQWSRGSHDLHHLYRQCNFGVLGVLDYLHGTHMRA